MGAGTPRAEVRVAFEAELAEGGEHGISGPVADVELDRVAIGPTRGPGPHHHVLGPGGAAAGRSASFPVRAAGLTHADVPHHAVPAARPSRTIVSPACGSGGPARVTGSSLPSARTRNSRSLPAGMPGSPPSPGWVQMRAPSA